MSNPPPIARSALVSLGLGTVFVAVGIGFVIAGFPSETEAQRAMLDAAGLPFALAVAVPITQMTIETRAVQRGGRGVLALYALAALAVVVGLVLYIVGFTAGPRSLVTTASTVTFAGLGLAFCFLAWKALRRERPAVRPLVVEQWLDADDDEGLTAEGYGDPAARKTATD